MCVGRYRHVLSGVMCCQNFAAHCQKQRHGSVSMLRCRCVSVTLPGWRSQQWEGSALPLARSAEGTVHLVVVLFYSLKQRNQIAPLINRAFSPAAGGYCWAKDPSSRMSSYCSPQHLYCHVLARVERSDWMGSPQTSRTGMAISYHSLRGTLLHWRCVVPFYLFSHAETQGEPTRPSTTGTKTSSWHGNKGRAPMPNSHLLLPVDPACWSKAGNQIWIVR